MAYCPDDVSYKAQLNALRANGYVMSDALYKVTLDGQEDHSGWLRLCVIIPPEYPDRILQEPLVEYRYSAELDGWTSDGVTTSSLAKGVHDDLERQGIPQ